MTFSQVLGHVTVGLVTEEALLLLQPRPLGRCLTVGVSAGRLIIGAVVSPGLAPASGRELHVVKEPVRLLVPVSGVPYCGRGECVD